MTALTILVSASTKECQVCGRTFAKPQNVTREKWATRKYCGRFCSYSRRSADMLAAGIKRSPEFIAAMAARNRRPRNNPAVFWGRVRKDESGCWLWAGDCYSNGYGRFMVAGKVWAAHRYSYEQVKGPIPEGLTLDHLCRVRNCVNPDHLEPVTLGENIRRGVGPTAQHARQTHCIHGHELSPENTIVTKRRRQCRTCAADWRRAARARRKGEAA